MESFLGKEKYSPNRRIAFPCFFTNVSILICVKKSLGKLEKIYLAALLRRKSRICRQIAGGNINIANGSRATKYRELKRQREAFNGGKCED